MERFGERLKSLRKAAGMTQQELADKLNVHLQTVSKWERGVSEPDFALLGEIASALFVPLERLIGAPEECGLFSGSFDVVREGRAIASARRARGEGQDEVAAAAGVSSDIVSKWERGITCPDMGQLCALASHFGTSASQLYFGVAQDTVAETPVQIVRRRRVSLAAVLATAFVAVAAIVLAIVLPQVLTRHFTVTVDGVEYKVTSDDWFVPATPQKTGYDFEYFEDSTGAIVNFPIKITDNAEYFPVFSLREYTIDYWLNGGAFGAAPAYTFNMESGMISLPAPYKKGASFEGWYLTPDFSGQAVDGVECCCSDIALYAKWSDGTFTVRYELCGGSLEAGNPSQVTSAREEELAEPVRAGYMFLGWFDSPEGGNRYESVGGESAKNLTLYARWQASGDFFSVTYNTHGGTLLGENPSSVGAGEVHTLYGAQREHYDFIGWNTAADGSGEWVERLYGIFCDIELHAVYSPEIYTVVYELDRGTYPGGEGNPNSIAYGDTVRLKPLLRAGHTFVGWFTSEVGGERITEINAGNIDGLTTIYARFTANKYVVELDGAGGTFTLGGDTCDYLDCEIYFGEELVLPECTLAGYDFIGWYDELGERVEIIDVESIGNMTLTAKYREAGLTYHIDYVLNGGTLKSPNPAEVAWGQVVGLNSPERKGWLFLGWNTAADGSGEYLEATPATQQSDLTVYAVWQEVMVNGSAEDFSFRIGPESVIITGYTGSFGKNVDLVIPAYIQDKPVVAIEGRFDRYTESHPEILYLNSLVIPGTVERLGDNCFNYMAISQPVVIPAGVKQIGKECFRTSDISIEFAEGSSLKSIGEYAFSGAYIHNIPVLPEGLERLESYAFCGALLYCGGIILPDTLEYIGGYALAVDLLMSNDPPCIYIPSSVRAIEPYAFGEGETYVYTALPEQVVAGFAEGWDYGTRVTCLESEVEGVTLRCEGGDVFAEGSHIVLPEQEREGCNFIGWREVGGDFVNFSYIPLRSGVVLEPVFEEASQEDGRTQYTPAVIEAGRQYEFVLRGSDALYFVPDVRKGGRFRITYRCEVVGCGYAHNAFYVTNEALNFLYSGVGYEYGGETFAVNRDVQCGSMLRFTVELEVL